MAGLLDNVSPVCYVLDWLPASYLGPSLVLQVECLDSMPGPLVQHDDVTLLLTMSEVLKQKGKDCHGGVCSCPRWMWLVLCVSSACRATAYLARLLLPSPA